MVINTWCTFTTQSNFGSWEEWKNYREGGHLSFFPGTKWIFCLQSSIKDFSWKQIITKNDKSNQLWSGLGPPGTSLWDAAYNFWTLSSLLNFTVWAIAGRCWGSGRENSVLSCCSSSWAARLICLQVEGWSKDSMIVLKTRSGSKGL